MKRDAKLLITFPKSNEDHRIQLVEINGAIFGIVFSPLESKGPIQLHCEEWSLVLLAPLKSESTILISATNVICLGEIASEESVTIHASNQLVTFAHLLKPSKKVSAVGQRDVFQFNDDPGALLYYYRLFEGIVSSAHNRSPEALAEAQQQLIAGLCTLADKIQGQPENLDLPKVLDMWNIPLSNPD